MIKSIIFDWGGVIAHGGSWEQISEKYEEMFSLSRGNVYPHLYKWYNKLKVSKINEEQFWSGFLGEVGIPLKEKERLKEMVLSSTDGNVDRRILDLIKQLKKNYFVGLLTNHVEFWFENERKKYDLDSIFDFIYTSYELKEKKPRKECFLSVFEKLPCFMPREYIFCDDNLGNVKTARKLGMNTHQYQSFSKLENFLLNMGIKY